MHRRINSANNAVCNPDVQDISTSLPCDLLFFSIVLRNFKKIYAAEYWMTSVKCSVISVSLEQTQTPFLCAAPNISQQTARRLMGCWLFGLLLQREHVPCFFLRIEHEEPRGVSDIARFGYRSGSSTRRNFRGVDPRGVNLVKALRRHHIRLERSQSWTSKTPVQSWFHEIDRRGGCCGTHALWRNLEELPRYRTCSSCSTAKNTLFKT